MESPGIGSTHMNRYENPKTGRYDGVHLYRHTGVNDYTNSVKRILRSAIPELVNKKPLNHTDSPQASYQKNQAFSVPTSNMFNLFNQGKL